MNTHSDYTVSIHYDRRLYRQDIAGSKAHAAMLAKQGIITQDDADSHRRRPGPGCRMKSSAVNFPGIPPLKTCT